jgi:hypothetical protein
MYYIIKILVKEVNKMFILQAFLAGIFLANGIPHFIKGITGQTHMTPFKRISNSYLNVVWGFINFIVGFLILGFNPINNFINLPSGINFWAFLIGAFFIAMMDAQLFSKPNARLPWHKD